MQKSKKTEKKTREQTKKMYVAAAAALVFVFIIAAVLFFGRAGGIKIEGYTPYRADDPSQGIRLDHEEITLDSIGYYEGAYVEDGSDEAVSAVAAAVFTNRSEAMLQIAEVEIKIGDGHTALFRLTNIPAGKSVLALDLNRLESDEEAKAVHLSDAATFFEEVPMAEELRVDGEKGRIALENETENTYPLVYVYYKTKLGKDMYLGGITYRVPYENVPAMTRIDSEAGHYDPDNSEILEVQILDGASQQTQ